MKVQPTGVVFIGECEIQGGRCTARTPNSITAVWTTPGREQVNVCRACLEEMVRAGEWEVEGARVGTRADVAVVSPDGDPLVFVEVKRRSPVIIDPEAWAIRIHRNLLVHGAVQSSRFFLLAAVPGPFYLWRARGQADPESPPDAVIDVDPATARKLEVLAERGAGAGELERAVAEWLTESIRGRRENTWLDDVGERGLINASKVVREYAM